MLALTPVHRGGLNRRELLGSGRQCTQFRASSDAASDSSGEATLDPSLDEDQSGYDPNDESEEAIEARLQDFLRRQALRESGARFPRDYQ